jgi:uncharacterized protein YciI
LCFRKRRRQKIGRFEEITTQDSHVNKLCVSICIFVLAAFQGEARAAVFNAGLHAPQHEAVKPEHVWFIFMETGRKTPDDKQKVAQMQRGHIENFKRLFGEQKLVAAGPLQDPGGHKRGIVVVKAKSKEDVFKYFAPDEYVRDGYLTLNAEASSVRKALSTEGIDPNGIEEVRIVQILRSGGTVKDGEMKANHGFLQKLVDKGTIGAWYSMEKGPVSEVLSSKTADTKMLQDAFSQYPALAPGGANVVVWRQWLGKGVLK